MRGLARGSCGVLGTGLARMVSTAACDPAFVGECTVGTDAVAVIVPPTDLLPRGGESGVPTELGGLTSCDAGRPGTLCRHVAGSEGVGTKGLARSTPHQYIVLHLIPWDEAGFVSCNSLPE